MTTGSVQFINNLTGSAATQGSTSHSHELGGPTHSRDHGVGEHGHTHEHLEHAGEQLKVVIRVSDECHIYHNM